MPPKHSPHREYGEIPLLHDAATWEEAPFESGLDDEDEQVLGEIVRSAGGRSD